MPVLGVDETLRGLASRIEDSSRVAGSQLLELVAPGGQFRPFVQEALQVLPWVSHAVGLIEIAGAAGHHLTGFDMNPVTAHLLDVLGETVHHKGKEQEKEWENWAEEKMPDDTVRGGPELEVLIHGEEPTVREPPALQEQQGPDEPQPPQPPEPSSALIGGTQLETQIQHLQRIEGDYAAQHQVLDQDLAKGEERFWDRNPSLTGVAKTEAETALAENRKEAHRKLEEQQKQDRERETRDFE